MGDTSKQYPDPLVRQRIFPEAAQIFAFSPVSLQEAIKDSVVVVDTNVLLIPYTTGQASLDQIRRTFRRLTDDGRLRVPGQVAREFADNRAEKLKTLFQQMSRRRDINPTRSEYPLLEGIATYLEVKKQEAEIITALEKYRKAVTALLDTVATWRWDDPMSTIYRDLFSPSTVVDPEVDREKLLEELKYRQEHKIPPGYKDANNEYSGIGDLLIWKAILKIGEEESRHLIFVSGDEKTDWRYQSENRALYPRIELVDEYRAASRGKSLLMITFAELLQQFGAPAKVVEEVRQEEVSASRLISAMATDVDAVNLRVSSLQKYLKSKYPDRQRHRLAEYLKLLRELKEAEILTLDELDQALIESRSKFEELERERISSGVGAFSDVGVVRISLRSAGILK